MTDFISLWWWEGFCLLVQLPGGCSQQQEATHSSRETRMLPCHGGFPSRALYSSPSKGGVQHGCWTESYPVGTWGDVLYVPLFFVYEQITVPFFLLLGNVCMLLKGNMIYSRASCSTMIKEDKMSLVLLLGGLPFTSWETPWSRWD